MGQNLSSTKINDTALDVVAAPDALNDLHLGIFFGGSFYAIGMIWFTIALIDRWRGPNGDRKTGFASAERGGEFDEKHELMRGA
ncbi:hypothetical protein BP6252_05669 [Coleophoma cylindrospora]|uniref:Uncharacterized protein n=1 Tax=Coleophoma cylindrospora TaxID=1849047 RepID=A0A3D8RUG3_9HELO|nr:hypothetical protein BP6252_05669 [Coleophoma cylindrospora]